jgi:hypothetical protein
VQGIIPGVEIRKKGCAAGFLPGPAGTRIYGSLFAVRVVYPFLDNPLRGPTTAVVVPALGGGAVARGLFLIVIVLVFCRRVHWFFRRCWPDGLLRVAPVVVPPPAMTGVVPPVVPPLPGALALLCPGLLPGLLLRWRLR